MNQFDLMVHYLAKAEIALEEGRREDADLFVEMARIASVVAANPRGPRGPMSNAPDVEAFKQRIRGGGVTEPSTEPAPRFPVEKAPAAGRGRPGVDQSIVSGGEPEA
jgi:hypothetical protein